VKWIYCGGATAILGRLIGKAPAKGCRLCPAAFCSIPWTSALAIAGRRRWRAARPRGLPAAAARHAEGWPAGIAGGAWQGKQIVPADWVRRIITPASRSRARAATATLVHL